MILVTGGTGYIGSHSCVALAQAGHELVIVDNLCNSQIGVLDRLANLCGSRPNFVEGDVRDSAVLAQVFAKYPVKAVMHFAGLKAVGESVAMPFAYYENNVNGSVQLLKAMRQAAIKTLVFSSTATVYAGPDVGSIDTGLTEDAPRGAAHPYGRSKLMVEDILADVHAAEADWRIARLRYFNPVGAHESGLIGEAPQGVPNNLFPYIAQVASGQRESLSVWGNDYATPDGTGVRDYLHVMDLAAAHLAALEYLMTPSTPAESLLTLNLGTGKGHSVFEVVRAFEQACGREIPYLIAPRRAGDLPQYLADPRLAEKLLAWKAQRTLAQMCTDAWRWQQLSGGA